MRDAFERAVANNPSHPLVPAIRRALKNKPKVYGGWSVLNKRAKR
jgi:hypothetical protein